MKHKDSKEALNLKKKIKYFLRTPRIYRKDVSSLIETISKFGRVAIFGGMLRDLTISSNYYFKSDIDLVIESIEENELNRLVIPFSPKINKFGGYRLQLSRWNVDLWRLENTWAFKNGLVKGESLKDLLKTTFFDWDAIIYIYNSSELFCAENYFEKIKSKVVDINLEVNPSPERIVIRIIRMLYEYNISLSPRLTQYLIEHLNTIHDSEIIQMKKKGNRQYLSMSKLKYLRDNLSAYSAESIQKPFTLPPLESSLPWD